MNPLNPPTSILSVVLLATLTAPAAAQTSLNYPLVFDNANGSSGSATLNLANNTLSVLARFTFTPRTVGVYGPAARGRSGSLLATLRYSTTQRAFTGGLRLTATTKQAVLDGLVYVQGSNASTTSRAQIDVVPGSKGPGLKVAGSATPGGTLSFQTGAQLVVAGLAMGPGKTTLLGRPVACFNSIPIGLDLRGPLFFVRKVDLPKGIPGPYHFAVQAFDVANSCLNRSYHAYRIAVR